MACKYLQGIARKNLLEEVIKEAWRPLAHQLDQAIGVSWSPLLSLDQACHLPSPIPELLQGCSLDIGTGCCNCLDCLHHWTHLQLPVHVKTQLMSLYELLRFQPVDASREPVCFKFGKCDSALYGKPTEAKWWAGARPSNRVFPWESGLENAFRLLWLALAETPPPWSETVNVYCLSSR